MRTIAITSGKGGVGKTNLTVNLAIALAQQTYSVVVFDADFSLANLDIVFGIRAEHTLADMINEDLSITDILVRGPHGVRVVAGGSGINELMHLNEDQINKFFIEFNKLHGVTDYLIFDTAAGLGEDIMRFNEAADEVILVSTPDPASAMDAYAVAKLIFSRNPDAYIRVLINMADNEVQAIHVYEKLEQIAKKFLNKDLHYAGYIPFDTKVTECIRKREPYILTSPFCAASKSVRELSAVLTGKPPYTPRSSSMSFIRSLLGLDEDVTAQKVGYY